MNIIGIRIRELRSEYTMTQKKLANRLALTPKMVSFYELGQRTPPMDIILKLSDIFNVSTDYLIGKVNEKSNYNLSVAHKIKILRTKFQDTADELAEYLNISAAEYKLIEAGKKKPAGDILKLLSLCYEVPSDYLTDSLNNQSDYQALEIQNIVKELLPEEKIQVIKYIQLIKSRNKEYK